MRKLLLLGSALALAPFAADAQRPPSFLQGQSLSYSMLNKAFQNTIALNGLSIVGACSGNSSPNGPNQATITVTCPGAGQPQGPNGSIQLNNGGLFSGVTMNGDAVMDANGVLTLNTVPVAKGGTGATTAAAARVNLGIATVGGTGAYSDLTGLPTLGTIASQAMPGAGLVNSTGTALTPVPAMSGDATLNLTTGVLTLGTVGVPKGGTGATAFTAHQLLVGQGQLGVTTTTGGTSGQVLTSQGPNSDPTWQTLSGGGGTGLSPIANNTLLANTSGFSANPISTTMTAMLDAGMGSTRGSILERGASGWQPIVPGTAGNCWTSNGINADPSWQPCSAGTSFSGTGGVVGVDANGTPFVFSLNNLAVSTGTGSGVLSVSPGGGTSSEQVNPQTDTTYTTSSGDATQLITFSNASPVAVTLPDPGTDILGGWFADFSNLGVGPVTFTPAGSTIDGAASITLYQGQGIRIVSDGNNYFTQRGGMQPTQIGPLINVLPGASAVADADTFPVVQSGTTASKQTMGAVWTWVGGHMPNYQPPQVIASTNFTLDANTHNGKIVTATAPITVSLPAALASLGVGFRTAIFNQSGGAITLSNAGASWGAWATSSGSLSIPNGQTALVTVIKPATAGVVFAAISTTASGGGSSVSFPPVSGRFYAPDITTIGNLTPVTGRLYALPYILRAGTYRGMAFGVQTGPSTTTTCRQGIYSDNGSGKPGVLLAENIDSVPTGFTGNVYNDFTGGDYTAATDIPVWLATTCNGPNGMVVYAADLKSGYLQGFTFSQLGSTNGFGVNPDLGLYSTVITTYPAGTLASTNSGNFGAVAYALGSVTAPNIRAR